MHQLIIYIAKYLVIVPPVVWLIVLARLPRQSRLGFIVFSATSAILTIVLVKIATTLHQDPRPFVRDYVVPYFKSSIDNGFPSDHTVFSMLLACIILRYQRWLGLGLIVVAITIGTARVISGVHHGQDIIGGLIIAALGVGLARSGEVLVYRVRSAKATRD